MTEKLRLKTFKNVENQKISAQQKYIHMEMKW